MDKVSGETLCIELDGQSLDEAVYQTCDLASLEDMLGKELLKSKCGIVDGHEIGREGATIFMRGPNADRILNAIQPILDAYPLCRNCRVDSRKGFMES